ncbi:hypothetical protein BGW80DRAFT_1348237 [Lactifluus volemus]|nr:hypothetical protein BGW80DRAFT_1348237 [Lactifluus volemus]
MVPPFLACSPYIHSKCMLLLFFKSALIFRNTYYKENAVLVFTGLERCSYHAARAK